MYATMGSASAAANPGPGFPAHFASPYAEMWNSSSTLMAAYNATGNKYYTLAFIIARQEGRGKDAKYLKEPSWDGRVSMDQNLYMDQIQAIRKRGGDVIMSFGGEAGRETAIVIEDPAELLAAYQSILDRYHFTWLDFDIEGSNLDKNPEASKRRNAVLAELQKKNAALQVTYFSGVFNFLWCVLFRDAVWHANAHMGTHGTS